MGCRLISIQQFLKRPTRRPTRLPCTIKSELIFRGCSVKETSISTLLKNNWPNVLLERIESVAGSGLADLNCVYKGFEFWLEQKLLDKRGSFEIRPSQIAWHIRRKRAGSKTFVLGRDLSELRLFVLSDDFETWRLVFRTSKPFDYEGLLREIMKHRDIQGSLSDV